jgi:Mismatch repair ATPase (MutS family)
MKALLDEPNEENLFKARKMRKALSDLSVDGEGLSSGGFFEEEEGEIEEGSPVLVKSVGAEGVVSSINKEKETAEVRLGRMKSVFPLSELARLKQKTVPDVPKSTARELRSETFSPELNLIGKNVLEALFELDAFLDKAASAGVGEVRIIHGYGTGKLREAVRKRLKENRSILEFRDGGYSEGQRGATIAKLII